MRLLVVAIDYGDKNRRLICSSVYVNFGVRSLSSESLRHLCKYKTRRLHTYHIDFISSRTCTISVVYVSAIFVISRCRLNNLTLNTTIGQKTDIDSAPKICLTV